MSRAGLGGRQAWLGRSKLVAQNRDERQRLARWRKVLGAITLVCPEPDHVLCSTAQAELADGAARLLGRGSLSVTLVAGARSPGWSPGSWDPTADGCRFETVPETGGMRLSAPGPRGLLYGVFALLERLAVLGDPEDLVRRRGPANGLRMLDHWDNMDGSIERGYAGRSLFFRNGKPARTARDLARIGEYARLLASTGINAVAINNVNVHRPETELIRQPLLTDVARIASEFRTWGIRLFLSVNYAAPLQFGLDTADPLDAGVETFWAERAREIWEAIPDFGGFLVKADSEGRPGPFTYGRTHADGANMLGRAVAPHGGLVLWRCFVYNCQQDWRDRSTDRARAAYDHFLPLDGQFLDNVILQIKNGPMDFQVREPVSPLFGALARTNQVLELQVTQEYTGQQRHLCCLLPQWQQILHFDPEPGTTVARVASGAARSRPLGGLAAVANVGDDDNWTGHHLAQVNLWGYGALAWDPDRPLKELLADWVALTFGRDPAVAQGLVPLLETSWAAYESYTAPLGVGWMVNPNHHYGPNVDGYEYSRWGTYHFADRDGIGVDRSVATGTGYAAQYGPRWAAVFGSVETCPDELLLFFHHVPWTHRLHDGRTVIQSIYDSHFAGVDWCDRALGVWDSLEPRLDPQRFAEVRDRLTHQAAHAREWRDQINTYCYRKSGIPDEKRRLVHP